MAKDRTYPAADAQAEALALLVYLGDRNVLDNAYIAGSLRRGKPEVHDIELVVAPRAEEVVIDLFGTRETRYPLDRVLDAMHADGLLGDRFDKNGRPAWGTRYKRTIWQGIPCDLFIVKPPSQLGVQLLIRTGPAEFSHRIVTPKRFGGLLPDELLVKDGALWRLAADGYGTAVPTPDEESAFSALGIDWIAPADRR